MIRKATDIYMINHKSAKKVDIVHEYIKYQIETYLRYVTDKKIEVKLEQQVKTVNFSEKKRCDIVLFVNDEIHAVFPVKFIMSNYLQNRNNNWENLVGECGQLMWANPKLKIVPINIIFDKVPYLKSSCKISKFEKITYESSFKITNKLVEMNQAYDIINLIINVDHISKIGEEYTVTPNLIDFHKKTPFTKMYTCFNNLL
jgi:hypothetical protein